MANTPLSTDEFAGLVALDSSWASRRPSMDVEIKLRLLGLIERNGMARMPSRTAKGDALVAERQKASND